MAESQNSTEEQQRLVRRLFRSRQQRVLGGVCGGLAEYFNVDVVVIRLLWILITLIGGAGLIAYLISWIIIPDQSGLEEKPSGRGSAGFILGLLLVIIGVIMLASWTGWYAFAFPLTIHAFMMPGLLVVLAVGLLLGWLLARTRRSGQTPPAEASSSDAPSETNVSRIYRSRDQRVLSGICGGLGNYFNLDPTIVRILWVLFAVASLGTALLLYVIMIFVIPEEPIA